MHSTRIRIIKIIEYFLIKKVTLKQMYTVEEFVAVALSAVDNYIFNFARIIYSSNDWNVPICFIKDNVDISDDKKFVEFRKQASELFPKTIRGVHFKDDIRFYYRGYMIYCNIFLDLNESNTRINLETGQYEYIEKEPLTPEFRQTLKIALEVPNMYLDVLRELLKMILEHKPLGRDRNEYVYAANRYPDEDYSTSSGYISADVTKLIGIEPYIEQELAAIKKLKPNFIFIKLENSKVCYDWYFQSVN